MAAERMTEADCTEALQSLDGWKIEEGKWLVKKYMFPTFPDAISFVRQVADVAEAHNHHPFIAIDYRKVTLRLTTWNAGGLTWLDFASAQAYDSSPL